MYVKYKLEYTKVALSANTVDAPQYLKEWQPLELPCSENLGVIALQNVIDSEVGKMYASKDDNLRNHKINIRHKDIYNENKGWVTLGRWIAVERSGYTANVVWREIDKNEYAELLL